jgi:hypothetical protein
MINEPETREQVAAQMQTLGKGIASAMGEDWACVISPTASEERNIHIVRCNPDFGFMVWRVWNDRTKLHIHCLWPKTRKGVTEAPYRAYGHTGAWFEIFVSANKTPDKIAADITRRLLPDYLKAYQEITARLADWDAREDRQLEFFERLSAILPEARRQTNNNGYPTLDLYPMGMVMCDIQAKSASNAKFSLEIENEHLAYEIARTIAEWHRAHPKQAN